MFSNGFYKFRSREERASYTPTPLPKELATPTPVERQLYPSRSLQTTLRLEMTARRNGYPSERQ